MKSAMMSIYKQKIKSYAQFITQEAVVLSVIVVNVIVMVALDTQPDLNATVGSWILWVDYTCVVYFVFEIIVKMLNLGVKGYFSDHWNKLDFVIILFSLPILIEPIMTLDSALIENVAILRLARFLRFLRLIRLVYHSETYAPLRVPVFILIALISTDLVIDSTGVMTLMAESTAAKINLVLAVLLVLGCTYFVNTTSKICFTTFIRKKFTQEPYLVDLSLLNFISLLFSIIILMFGLMLATQTSGHDPFAIIAGLGIGGMAIAFAARDFVANIIAGITLLIYKPFKTGDWISINGNSGSVVEIGLRSTVLEQFGGEYMIFPNKMFIEVPVQNVDKRSFYLVTGSVKLHSDTSSEQIEKVIAILKGACKEHAEIYDACGVSFKGFGEAHYPISFWIVVKQWNAAQKDVYRDHWEKMRVVEQDFYLEVIRAFEENHIYCAVPLQTINISKDPESQSGIYH